MYEIERRKKKKFLMRFSQKFPQLTNFNRIFQSKNIPFFWVYTKFYLLNQLAAGVCGFYVNQYICQFIHSVWVCMILFTKSLNYENSLITIMAIRKNMWQIMRVSVHNKPPNRWNLRIWCAVASRSSAATIH